MSESALCNDYAGPVSYNSDCELPFSRAYVMELQIDSRSTCLASGSSFLASDQRVTRNSAPGLNTSPQVSRYTKGYVIWDKRSASWEHSAGRQCPEQYILTSDRGFPCGASSSARVLKRHGERARSRLEQDLPRILQDYWCPRTDNVYRTEIGTSTSNTAKLATAKI